jgi:hypothetical protein
MVQASQNATQVRNNVSQRRTVGMEAAKSEPLPGPCLARLCTTD